MKKLGLLVCLLPFFSVSQKYERSYESLSSMNHSISTNMDNYFLSIEAPLSERVKHDVKTMTITLVNKGREKPVLEYQFNDFGRITMAKTSRSKKTLSYVSDTLISETILVRKKKVSRQKHAYENAQLVKLEKFVNDQLKGRYTIAYNGDGEIAENSFETGRKLQKNYVLRHTFNKDNQRTETVYMQNGKITRRWQYDCKSEGELVEVDKKEELSSRCKYNEDFADGSYIVYTRTIEKGKQYLHKSTYTKDSVFVSHEQFLNDSILVRRSTLNDGISLYEEFKNGKLKYGFVRKIDSKGRTLKHTAFNGSKRKETYSREYTYNDKGLVTETRVLHKGKEVSLKRIKYTYL